MTDPNSAVDERFMLRPFQITPSQIERIYRNAAGYSTYKLARE
jgi:hypothetical protein